VLRLTRGVGRAVAVVLSVAALLVAALLMRLGTAESAHGHLALEVARSRGLVSFVLKCTILLCRCVLEHLKSCGGVLAGVYRVAGDTTGHR